MNDFSNCIRAHASAIKNNHRKQFEQKKFLQQHKVRADSYSKAAATMKKQRKKKNTAANADKEIKVNTCEHPVAD